MLHIVAKNDSPLQRIAVARLHIETEIAHIIDVAQTRVLEHANTSAVDELRLIGRPAIIAPAGDQRLGGSMTNDRRNQHDRHARRKKVPGSAPMEARCPHRAGLSGRIRKLAR